MGIPIANVDHGASLAPTVSADIREPRATLSIAGATRPRPLSHQRPAPAPLRRICSIDNLPASGSIATGYRPVKQARQ